jgi:hypothetical protein
MIGLIKTKTVKYYDIDLSDNLNMTYRLYQILCIVLAFQIYAKMPPSEPDSIHNSKTY